PSPRRQPTGGRFCSIWRRPPSRPDASATRPTRVSPARPAGCSTRTVSPSTDPLEAREKGGFLTSLGGSPENSSYKGYGLAVMVNILGACLSGASLITDPMHTKKPQGNDIGHSFIAIDPGLFRDREELTADV